MTDSRHLHHLDLAGADFEQVVAQSSGVERAVGVARVLGCVWPDALGVGCRLEIPEGEVMAAFDEHGQPAAFADADSPCSERCELGDPSLGTLVVKWKSPPAESDRVLLRLCARDLTSRLRFTDLLDTRRRCEDLIELGELAGPVMHEFNNLLNSLSLRLALIEQDLGGVNPGVLDHIRRQASAAAALVGRFQNYRKSRANERRPIDLARVLTRFAATNAGIQYLGGEASAVLWDVQDLQNLLTFLTRVGVAHDPRGVTVCLDEVGNWVAMRFDLVGPPATNDYFSPRPDAPAPSTGLELAACRSLVSRAGGRIRATGQDDGRVTIHVEMPPVRA